MTRRFSTETKLGRAVLALWPLIVIGAICLDDLSIINVRSEGQFNGLNISLEHHGKLDAILEPCGNVTYKSVSRGCTALPDLKEGTSFVFGINRAKRPTSHIVGHR